MLSVGQTILEEAVEVGLPVRNLLVVLLGGEQTRLLLRVDGRVLPLLGSRLFPKRLLLRVLGDLRDGYLVLVHQLDPVATRARALVAHSFVVCFQSATQVSGFLGINLKLLLDLNFFYLWL